MFNTRPEQKSAQGLETMDRACRVVRQILSELSDMVEPGISTADLDRYAERRLGEEKARPAFKGYAVPGRPEFPAVLCTSINEEIVHGVPSTRRVLKEGDILSMDFGAVVDGMFGDSAVTVPVGGASTSALDLIKVTRDSLYRGIETIRSGNWISDISRAIQTHAESHGYGVVRCYTGHGIGRHLHEEPQVPNFIDPHNRDRKLCENWVLAIEPMITVGDFEVVEDENDKWTARTRDGSLSAHWELSVAVTPEGPWILGEPDEEKKRVSA